LIRLETSQHTSLFVGRVSDEEKMIYNLDIGRLSLSPTRKRKTESTGAEKTHTNNQRERGEEVGKREREKVK
jgi:hypothetical protein